MKKDNKKRMKKNERKLIGILVCITIIAIVILFFMNRKNTNNDTNVESNNRQNTAQEENTAPEEEFVKVLEDGTKQNVSNKLSETKTLDGMEISNIQITEQSNETILIATITNPSNEAKGGYPVDVIALDKDGNEIQQISGYVGTVQAGQSMQFTVSSTSDYANVYDVKIVKK